MTLRRFGALVLFLLSFCAAASAGDRPQYVIISFDGASHIEQWERSRSLARETGARFTYFLSCVYLLSPQTRGHYKAPGVKPGRSNVGYGSSREDVEMRLRQIWRAHNEGHEIANHGCGHFDGTHWTESDWESELKQFATIIRDAWTINRIEGEPDGWRKFAETEIIGFRAPYLAVSQGLAPALSSLGFRYDASTVSRGPAQPSRKDSLVSFSLPLIPEGPSDKRIIAMDYNLYVRHSGGFEKPSQAEMFADRAFRAFHAAFEREFAGKRTPLQLGFHFTLMNDGAYWRALERFAKEVCAKTNVRCVSYKQYLNETAAAESAAARADDRPRALQR